MIEINAADKPRYVRSKPLSHGGVAWYWSPPTKFKEQGCAIEPDALGEDMIEAFKRAEELNEALDAWREGRTVEIPANEGTLDWLFQIYRAHRRFKTLDDLSKRDYQHEMSRIADFLDEDGDRLGTWELTDIGPDTVDDLYGAFVESGLTRKAEYAISVGQTAWGVARRKLPGIVPAENPFAGVDKEKRQKRETIPATFDELEAFCDAAVAAGKVQLAFAARACCDLLMRPEDVFLRLGWPHWRPPGQQDRVAGLSTKNHNDDWIKLEGIDPETGEIEIFYPELEDYARQLFARGRKGDLMVMRPKTRGKQKPGPDTPYLPYTRRLWAAQTVAIREAAGLPKHVTMESFRHLGATELGDVGLPDTYAQALTRHKHRGTLDHYVHRTGRQKEEATRLRVQHRNKTRRR